MFFKRTFDKIGQLVTGDEDSKKAEDDQKKEVKSKPETNFNDLLSGKDNQKTLTNRETARTAVPFKRDLVADQRYEKPATSQNLTPN